MSIASIITLGIIAALIFALFSTYNQLVILRNRFQNAFAQIEVQLKRRYDLIPNLVETAKGYLAHERDTLEAVIAARNGAVNGLKAAAAAPGNAQSMAQLGSAEGLLNSAMGRLTVTMEAYPELKASANMLQLTEELSSTENKVAFARQAFNDAVMEYNTCKQSFPAVLFAASFGHGKDATPLEFADSAEIQAAPKVSF